MKKPNIALLTLVLTIFAPTARAADLTASLAAFAVSLVLLGCIVVVIAANGRLKSVKRDHQELTERFFLNERAVDRLQKERKDLATKLDEKDAQIAAVDAERSQIERMLSCLREQVEKTARIDGLTGIPNLHQLDQTLSDEIKRAVRARRPLSLLLAEIDKFDDYRSAESEVSSESALQKIATGLSDSFRRAGDLVARSGDARFAVVLPGTDPETAARFAEKLRRSVYEMCIPFTSSEVADRVTVSVGFVCVPANRLSKTANVFTIAETALCQAQADGCNRIAQVAIAA